MRSDRQPSGGQINELHDFFIDVGFRAERGGALELALGMYADAVVTKPESALAWYNYGDVLLALKRFDPAIEALRKAVEISPRTALFHYDLGLALYDTGRYKEAKAEFQLIVDWDPKLKRGSSNLLLSSLTNLALCEGELGNSAAGAQALAPARSTAIDILYNLGRLNHQAKRWPVARPLAEAAATLDPTSEEIMHQLGAILLDSGHPREALPILEKATRLDPKCAYAWYALGATYVRLKARKKARAAFEKSRRLAPEYALPYYDLACLDARDRKLDVAFKNLKLAWEKGYRDVSHIRRDPDLSNLRRDRRWKAFRQAVLEVRP